MTEHLIPDIRFYELYSPACKPEFRCYGVSAERGTKSVPDVCNERTTERRTITEIERISGFLGKEWVDEILTMTNHKPSRLTSKNLEH